MSTLAGRQINVMMRLKSHFQIIPNLVQVTNYFIIPKSFIKLQYCQVPQKLLPARLKLFTNTA